MTDERFDVDRSTEQAWTDFRRKLADFLGDLAAGQVAQIGLGGVGEEVSQAAPYVTFMADCDGEQLLAVLVDPSTVRPPIALSTDQATELQAAGWFIPGGNPGDAREGGTALLRVTKERRFADELAVLAMDALRDIYGVVHPAFLVGGPLGEVEEAAPEPTCVPPTLDPLTAYLPEDYDELNAQVSAALTPMFGHEPVRDEDGDIAISDGRFWLYVRVCPKEPVIQVFGPVLDDVRDTAFAAVEVAILNRDSALVHYFCADDDSIQAIARIPAVPFVPHHLLALIGAMMAKLNEVHTDLELRVGFPGTSFGTWPVDIPDDTEDDDDQVDEFSPTCHEGEPSLPLELLTLINLGANERVDSSLIAQIFHNNPDLLVDAIRIATDQSLEWRQSAVAAVGDEDSDEAESCAMEFMGWNQTVSDLRRGLKAAYAALAEAERRTPPEQIHECHGPAA